MNKTILLSLALIAGCRSEAATDKNAPHAPTDKADKTTQIEHGKHLVLVSACNDCHTPFKMGERGPEPDLARALSGHPAGMALPPVPELPPGPWIGLMLATNTAWAGPWGVSFTANLTPDPETGTGTWTKQMFIDIMRNQRHLGAGRPLLPPMPAAAYANYSDDDLGAILAYLQSLPPIKNAVPQPIPPKQVAAQ